MPRKQKAPPPVLPEKAPKKKLKKLEIIADPHLELSKVNLRLQQETARADRLAVQVKSLEATVAGACKKCGLKNTPPEFCEACYKARKEA